MSKLLYNGQPIEWRPDRGGTYGWYVIPIGGCSPFFFAQANTDGRWDAFRPVGSAEREPIGGGRAYDFASAKAAAEKCLLDNGIVTLAVKSLPTTSAYTFHFRADKGGATVVATVVRGPDTTVLYGVSFCSPRDSFDKNLGRHMAAFRLIDKPSTLVLPGLVGPREIKAAILAALVIPPGNRLVR